MLNNRYFCFGPKTAFPQRRSESYPKRTGTSANANDAEAHFENESLYGSPKKVPSPKL